MSGAPLLAALQLLLAILTIVQSVGATSDDSSPFYDDHGGLTNGHEPINDGSPGGSSQGGDSVEVIGSQPATVQLGAGFIVGCILGVILYGTTRIGLRLVRRRGSRTRERERNEGMTEAVLVDV